MTDITLPETVTRESNGPLTLDDLKHRLRWISEYVEWNGWAPSHREMGHGWGVSAAAVKNSLEAMEERGWIEWVQGQGRMLRFTEAGKIIAGGRDGSDES